MAKFKSREIIIVLGRTGQGKSIWTRKFMHNKKRVFAFDPLQDFNAFYLPIDEILKNDDAGLYYKPNYYRVGIIEPDDLDLIAALAFISGDCWLVVEEGGFIFPAGSRSPDWMRDGVFLGRHQKLNILITAQRPTSIPVDLRSQATRVICFSQREQRDMSWLGEFFGERYKEIPNLKPLQCLDASGDDITKYQIDYKDDDKKKNEDEKSKQFLHF